MLKQVMLKQVQHDNVEEISYIEPAFKDKWRDMPEKSVNIYSNAYAISL